MNKKHIENDNPEMIYWYIPISKYSVTITNPKRISKLYFTFPSDVLD
jgi:hypothetical protein